MPNKDLNKDYEYVSKIFESFKGFMEIKDFRTFLLTLFSEDGSDDVMAKIMGSNNHTKNLHYDIGKKSYLIELLPSEKPVIIYLKSKNDFEKKVIKAEEDKEFFDKYLSTFEQETLMDKKTSIQIIEYLNKTFETNAKYNINAKFEVTKIYSDLLSYFFNIGKVRSLLILNGKGDDPDIIFSLEVSFANFMNEEYVSIHAFIDHEKRFKDSMFIKINKNTYEFEGIKELEETTHSELYNHEYLLLIHVNSFDEF